MNEQTGPKIVSLSKRVCYGCKYNFREMLRSGRQPIYRSFCRHEKWTEAEKFPDENGRYIGIANDTPQWCPVKPWT